jgi:hypothetical protein
MYPKYTDIRYELVILPSNCKYFYNIELSFLFTLIHQLKKFPLYNGIPSPKTKFPRLSLFLLARSDSYSILFH